MWIMQRQRQQRSCWCLQPGVFDQRSGGILEEAQQREQAKRLRLSERYRIGVNLGLYDTIIVVARDTATHMVEQPLESVITITAERSLYFAGEAVSV